MSDRLVLIMQAWLVSGLALLDAALLLRRILHPNENRSVSRFSRDRYVLFLKLVGAMIVAVSYGLALLGYISYQLAAELIQSGLLIILTILVLRELVE